MAGLTTDASPEAWWLSERLEVVGVPLWDQPSQILGANCSDYFVTEALAEAKTEVG